MAESAVTTGPVGQLVSRLLSMGLACCKAIVSSFEAAAKEEKQKKDHREVDSINVKIKLIILYNKEERFKIIDTLSRSNKCTY